MHENMIKYSEGLSIKHLHIELEIRISNCLVLERLVIAIAMVPTIPKPSIGNLNKLTAILFKTEPLQKRRPKNARL